METSGALRVSKQASKLPPSRSKNINNKKDPSDVDDDYGVDDYHDHIALADDADDGDDDQGCDLKLVGRSV